MTDKELLQDGPGCSETRRYALWFASRMDAMWLVRRAAAQNGVVLPRHVRAAASLASSRRQG